MRFSIMALLVVVAFAGISCAALAYPDGLWSHSFRTIVVAGLICATIGAALKESGPSRAFWASFAIAAWVMFLESTFAFGGGELISDVFLKYVGGRVLVSDPTREVGIGDIYDRSSTAEDDRVMLFVATGHDILTIIVAVLAGYAGRGLYLRNPSKKFEISSSDS